MEINGGTPQKNGSDGGRFLMGLKLEHHDDTTS